MSYNLVTLNSTNCTKIVERNLSLELGLKKMKLNNANSKNKYQWLKPININQNEFF